MLPCRAYLVALTLFTMAKKTIIIQKIKGNGNTTNCNVQPERETCIDCIAMHLKHQEKIIELLTQRQK